ncbi:heparinase II/III family protein [Haladaptatus sp. DYSN1]|uniref:heparinase II/III domain-containing protein n=2 Tax=Haladaptatus TaxID=367188 RepID=UPI00240609BC|nr:heparinase II/III family protein [Haladaptatus sp. DYSN1]
MSSHDDTPQGKTIDWADAATGDGLLDPDRLLPDTDRRRFLKASGVAALGSLFAGGASGATPTTNTAGKTRVTYFTEADRQAARENVENYEWAKAERDDAVSQADTVLSTFTLDDLWRYVGSQDIPRAAFLANGNAGYYPWESEWGPKEPLPDVSYATKPGEQWKITNGEYTLPTNDFEAYRESGMDDEGKFDPTLADDSLLVNEEHPEMGEGWGVDDGTGWVDEDGDLGTAGVRWVPVAWAHHWNTIYGYRSMLNALYQAYLFTEEQRYARAATVVLDRVGDVYPEFNLLDTVQFESGGYSYLNGLPISSHGGTGRGKQVGSIWESFWVKAVLKAYDAVFPGQDGDAELVEFLSGKAAQYPGLGPKDSLADVRRNIEEGLLQQILPAMKNAQIRGNFGSHQTTLALSAIIQDMPNGYTADALDFLFQAGGLEYEDDGTPWGNWYISGGDVLSSILTKFDRDGHPYEGSIHYNSLVASALQGTADALNGYDAYEGADLYQNPIFKQSFQTQHQVTFLNKFVPKYGDNAGAGEPGFENMIGVDNLVRAYDVYGGDDLARWIYLRNRESMDGLRQGIYNENPNSVKADIEAILEAKGPLDIGSTQLAGQGLTALRSGEPDVGRAVWTYYGRNGFGPDSGYGAGHTHRDTLNIGLFGHGLNLSPDLGYPEETGNWPKRWNWTGNTISHNTVLVDEQRQDKQWVSTPRHFDHTDRVQLFEIDAANVYPQCEQYERTTAQVTIDDENSYVVDFFRVDGGDDHIFSFHGGTVPTDQFTYELNEGVSEFVVRNGGGSLEASREKSYSGTWSTRVRDPSGDVHDWRGLSVDTGTSDVDVSVKINTSVTGYNDYWHHNHSVYLGQDGDGKHVVAGVGNQAADDDPRMGLYYPEDNTWGDHKSIADWEKATWYTLNVSKTGTSVEVSLGDESGTTHDAGAFTLPSDTDGAVGVFGGIGKGQTGALYFDDFVANGSAYDFFSTNYTEQAGIETAGLDLVAQNGGTYAGTSVPKPGYGEDTTYNDEVGNGFNYLYNVERDDAPGESFAVDWDLEDYWDVLDEPADVHLRMTMLTDVDEVAICNGDPPQRWGNPETFKYVLARRMGNDLSTQFTSVFESYDGERQVESITEVPVASDDPTARAVKVELTTGQTDYVVSASNHELEHAVGDVFSFVGAFAVYSTDVDGSHKHAYVHDGKLLIAGGDQLINESQGRIEGTVEDFTRDLSMENVIDIKTTSGNSRLAEADGMWIYADAVEMRNGAYAIRGIESGDANRATVDIGERTTVKEFIDPKNPDAGYEYILEAGGEFVIPLSASWSA